MSNRIILDTDYFPDCVLPDCTDQTVHQHILPKQQQVMDSVAKYLFGQGGVGSSKSMAFAAKTVKLSLSIPNNVGVVTRKDFKLLYKSSWLDVKKCIERLVKRQLIDPPKYSDKRQGDYTSITFHNGSVLYAMQGKNWSEGLGASYGFFWVDDAMESYEELFIGDETSAGLLSRLRLPNVHYDKRTYDSVQREHGSLHGMVSTNPPPVGHWLHKLFGKVPGMHKIGNDTVEWIMTATHENPFVGADYAKGLMAVQDRMGRSKNVARRVIFGESIPAYGGVPVFPQFKEERHVTPIVYDAKLPLVRSWDFGFHHPAVIFSNLYKCIVGNNHYRSLSEVTDQFACDVWELYAEVKQHTALLYKDAALLLDAGDRAGYRRNDANKDKRGPIRILQDEYNLSFKFRFLDLENSLEYCRSLLKKVCECGEEMIQISPGCEALIGALQGGYKYPKSRDGKAGNKPIEDRYFADTACAWRYGAENYVKWELPLEYRKSLMHSAQSLSAPLSSAKRANTPWSWMEMSDSEIAAMLIH
jgi:hypothetical protein